MLTLIYTYRNRDLQRLVNSIESLKNQTTKKFEVFLVDYGSNPEKSGKVKAVCEQYSFVKYRHYHTQHQPWNKSRALNSVIKNLETSFCFIADVDMIFHPDFVLRTISLQTEEKSIYFQVGFLESVEAIIIKQFGDFKKFRKSNSGATGLSMFPVRVLKELRGFDEFYHFWGAEDTDMHVRIKNAGYEVEFYDEEVLMLHQWHPSYRSAESSSLSKGLQISGIVQLNHQHSKYAFEYKTTIVNRKNWGECISDGEFNELEKAPVNFVLDNERRKIDHFLFALMPEAKNEILKITIEKDPFQNSLRFRAKRLLRKKVPEYYSLKEINDKILLHLISFYRNKAYTYKISDDFKNIEVAVKF